MGNSMVELQIGEEWGPEIFGIRNSLLSEPV